MDSSNDLIFSELSNAPFHSPAFLFLIRGGVCKNLESIGLIGERCGNDVIGGDATLSPFFG